MIKGVKDSFCLLRYRRSKVNEGLLYMRGLHGQSRTAAFLLPSMREK